MGEAANKVWEDLLSKGLGDAEGSTNSDLDLKLGISNIYSAEAVVNHSNNHTLDQAEKNLINGSFATPGADVSFNTNQNYEGQASKAGLDLKLATETEDPKKLKRIMGNRISSRNYRKKKMLYMDHLEKLTFTLQRQISDICQQIEQTKIEQRSMLIEQHQLKLQIAASEKERIVKEVEIGKNTAEVNRLRELQFNQLQAKQHDDGLLAVNAQLDLNL